MKTVRILWLLLLAWWVFPAQADEGNGFVRAAVAEVYGEDAAQALTVQYGGSMNAGNAEELLAKENVDGGLIGGASLKAKDFAAIVAAASK